ncbi:chemotaxis protein CheA [Sedimenticola selenatireducens]|uniref:Chemotaxis protein CheA n=1 Tax=Sedimenticola selenatireducens TaxID=191960 RepID=A0A557SG05_9GAMM|nr:chemotaxis protein CheA [Sedimenticola selenatireducens]TVO76311.1 chemotaxis protein CheA [Sedimenticola selenatireducens]TVT61421.1 MAG: chemotaxis protein CheA [Sedimenticola selenatireducens]
MAIDLDDEILQDFLVEAGEILEQLSEQLVDLEQRPDDFDLLNAVFRGFHTIKGGAGFLSIDPLVNVCHVSEDVFNVLRQGQRNVDAVLMDAVLQVLDVVNEMFALVQSGEEPEEASPELLETLARLAIPESESVGEEAPDTEVAEVEEVMAETEQAASTQAIQDPALGGGDEITEDEFEALLDQLHGTGKHAGVPAEPAVTPAAAQTKPAPSASDEITEDEFENLLDQLHGKGQFGGAPALGDAPSSKETVKAASKPPAKKPSSDEITEEEFDALLDELHGKGQFGVVNNGASAPSQTAEKKPVAAPKKAAPAAAKAKPEATIKRPAPAKEEDDKKQALARKAAPQAETTIRVDTARLDEIMNMVGELVLVRNRLETLKAKLGDEEVATAVANLDVVTSDLQNSVMKTRMQPVKKVFGRFPRVVRDLARSLKKEIDLELHGEDTDLDKNLVEALSDPMVHLVRNAVDHGIESPDEREAAGKPRKGTVVLSAAQAGDHILLTIADDGKGMDPDVLRRKAVEKGMMDEEAAARLDDKDCYNLIFAAGFSTKTEISDVSGRGVGMDVVKTRIAQMNGQVEIDSEYGKGSLITIKLPLTLAILPTLMVVLGSQPFALPLASVVEIFNLDLRRTHIVDGQLTIMVRERALPLFYLHKWLVPKATRENREAVGHVVVVTVGNAQVGLVVDHLIGQEEVVIKPLGALLQGLDGMAGATITGDGNIALILDIPGLMRKYARR